MYKPYFLLIFIFIQLSSLAQEKYAQNFDGVYRGKTKKKAPQGKGTYLWQDGTKYDGLWENGLMHGFGRMYFANGNVYEGNFANGLMEGKGNFTWGSGDRYVGWFRQGKKTGQGRLTFVNGEIHEGKWIDGLANGYGEHFWSTGSKYKGGWKDNKRHGEGVLTYADGKVEQGTWKNDKYVPCQCEQNLTTQARYEQANAVFIGRIINLKKEDSQLTAEVEVSTLWKGQLFPKKRTYLSAQTSSCDFIFKIGQEYLVFAEEVSNRNYHTNQCMGSALLENVHDEIEQLNNFVVCEKEPNMANAIYYNAEDYVCGCNGVTYRNPYEAQKNGVQFWNAGQCKEN